MLSPHALLQSTVGVCMDEGGVGVYSDAGENGRWNGLRTTLNDWPAGLFAVNKLREDVACRESKVQI